MMNDPIERIAKRKRKRKSPVSYLNDKCVCGHSMMYHDFSSPNPNRRWCGEVGCDCSEYRAKAEARK